MDEPQLERCSGYPPGSCNNAAITGFLCRTCAERAEAAYQAELLANRCERHILAGIETGTLPLTVRDWCRIVLTAQQRDVAQAIGAHPECSVWLSGESGRGKSWIARWATHRTLRAGRSAAWMSAYDLVRLGVDYERTSRVQSVQLLVIDDMHRMSANQRALDALHNILEARNANEVRTIITSELDAAKTAAQIVAATGYDLNTSTFRRLSRPGAQLMHLKLTGEDLRRCQPDALQSR